MEKRLHLLCQVGLLDQDIHDGMLHVVNQLETCWAIPVRNAQGGDGDNPYGERADAQPPG